MIAPSKAVILSLKGCVVSDEERRFFQDARPLGFILFARNCENPRQLKTLTDDLRSIVGWRCPILIDQEGGRVQRLKPPFWRQYPAMKHFGDVAREDLEQGLSDLRFTILQMAEELVEAGVNVNCAPVLDVLSAVTHDAIGDRAFSDDPEQVGRLGLSVCRHLLAAGVTPVIKHLPGHGRGAVDSHKDLPCVSEDLEVLTQSCFDPFRIVSNSDVGDKVWGMVAHIVFDKIDTDHPASVSKLVIQDIIRGTIGFEGLLVSDDLDMAALAGYGSIAARAARALAAGCDVALYCAGDLDTMRAVIKAVPNLSAKAQKRLQKSGFEGIVSA